MRAHYPAEHLFEDKRRDLELQLFHNDTLDLHLGCSSGRAAISLFFDLNGTEPNNGFFDFTKSSNAGTIDISKILDIASSMKSTVSGYTGTDSMPPCSNGVCWYLYEKVFAIT